jgi:hypothetical protein
MPRIWFSFPRILGIRPGISFSTSELKGKPYRRREVVTRRLRSTPLPSNLFEALQPPQPPPKQAEAPEWAQLVACLFWLTLLWGLMVMVGCWINVACRIYSEGTDMVEVCGDARGDYSASVTDRHGHTRQYGEPNGGFERYPGQGGRPVYERRDGD